jgi:hypothetical protein
MNWLIFISFITIKSIYKNYYDLKNSKTYAYTGYDEREIYNRDYHLIQEKEIEEKKRVFKIIEKSEILYYLENNSIGEYEKLKKIREEEDDVKIINIKNGGLTKMWDLEETLFE